MGPNLPIILAFVQTALLFEIARRIGSLKSTQKHLKRRIKHIEKEVK